MACLKPHVGLGVIFEQEGKFLVSKRIGHFANGLYSIPGGALEPGESAVAGAKREGFEETGLIANQLSFICYTNNLQTHQETGLHFISLIFHCDDFSGALSNKEPDKHEAWFLVQTK